MKEVLISFAVFVFCIGITIFSQINSPKVANALESNMPSDIANTSIEVPKEQKSNIFELDPSDPNPKLFAMADDSLEAGKATTTDSGLIFLDLAVGEGQEATPGSTVTVNYTGTLENGEQFDTSIGRAPFTFPLGAGRVIKGWDEGVAGMKVGGKRKLTIPPELGYGSRGAGNVIPANATLIFEVELLKVD